MGESKQVSVAGPLRMAMRSAAGVATLAAIALAGCEKAPEKPAAADSKAASPTASAPASAPASKPATQPRVSRPATRFDALSHNFGTTWVGPVLKHAFTLRNEGDQPLVIQGVDPECGCTTAGEYARRIDPGGSTRLPFSLDSTHLSPGQYRKSITVRTNDPLAPAVKLVLEGVCRYYVEVEPVTAAFGIVTGDQMQRRIVKIKNNTEKPLQLTMTPVGPDSKFNVALAETVPGKEFELHVTSLPPYVPGMMTATVLMTTNLDEQKQVNVPVVARVPDRIDVIPAAITLMAPAAGSSAPAQMRQVTLTNYGATPVSLLAAEVDDPRLVVTTQPQPGGKSYMVRLQIPAGYEPPPTGRALTLKTNDAQKPVIKVPIARLGGASAATKASAYPAEALAGKPAPAIALRTLDGAAVSNADFARFPATVLNVVAADCPVCKKQIPVMESVRRDFSPRGVRFVNVCVKRVQTFSDEQVRAVVGSLGSRLELAHDAANTTMGPYRVTATPTQYIIDSNGVVRHVIGGLKRAADVRVYLKQMLDGEE